MYQESGDCLGGIPSILRWREVIARAATTESGQAGDRNIDPMEPTRRLSGPPRGKQEHRRGHDSRHDPDAGEAPEYEAILNASPHQRRTQLIHH